MSNAVKGFTFEPPRYCEGEMRQRKVKNIEEKLENCGKLLVEAPIEHRGNWQRIFPLEQPLYLEIGCGRGGFITGIAGKNPDKNFIGVEGHSSVALRALQNIGTQGVENVRIIAEYINDPEDWFAENEISGIYLNFSDPWPKDRHAKRRLTSPKYISSYKKILKPGAFIEIKTDNEQLFEYSVKSVKDAGLIILELSEDLHKSSLDARNVMTEYEKKFQEEGKRIKYLKTVLKVI